MNTKQNDKLSMYIAVRDYLAKFLTLLAALPNFQVLYALLQNLILLIEGAEKQQEADKSGFAAAKTKQKKLLARLAVDAAQKLVAYAKITNKLALEKEMAFNESQLLKMTDTRLKGTAQSIYDKADTNIANLATYQVTADTQDALQEAIDVFDKMIGTPRVEKVETSKATKQISTAFESVEDTLDKLDAVMKIIRYTQVDFYNGYGVVRKPMNTGRRSVAIKGLVTDAATGEGVKGAVVSFTLNNGALTAKSAVNGKPDFTKKSAAKGGFFVNSAAEGTYQVTVTLPGYKKALASISVVSGQMSVLAVMLEKE